MSTDIAQCTMHTFITRKLSYRKDDRAMPCVTDIGRIS